MDDSQLKPESRDAELAYQAFRSGIIDREFKSGFGWWQHNGSLLEDEYRFARRHFPTTRVTITYLLRLITLHNPFTETAAYIKTNRVRKLKASGDSHNDIAFREFSSSLLQAKPLVTVIIPTLNRYSYLENVLRDFENQDYRNLEIIVVDQSDNYQPEFYKNFNLRIDVIYQQEKALWLARNNAVKKSKGDYIALSEDDVRIPPDWISNHIKCIDFFNVDISAGVFFPSGSRIPAEKSYFRWAEQFATGNALLKKSVFNKTGLFDRQFEKQRMGDGEFGLRAYLSGFRSISNPYAWCEDLKAASGGLREAGAWDAFRPKHFWSPRPLPSVLYFYRKYFGQQAALFMLFYNVPPSIVPYRYKRNRVLRLAGSFLAILLFPLILLQVATSWWLASQMLKHPKIEMLND